MSGMCHGREGNIMSMKDQGKIKRNLSRKLAFFMNPTFDGPKQALLGLHTISILVAFSQRLANTCLMGFGIGFNVMINILQQSAITELDSLIFVVQNSLYHHLHHRLEFLDYNGQWQPHTSGGEASNFQATLPGA